MAVDGVALHVFRANPSHAFGHGGADCFSPTLGHSNNSRIDDAGRAAQHEKPNRLFEEGSTPTVDFDEDPGFPFSDVAFVKLSASFFFPDSPCS